MVSWTEVMFRMTPLRRATIAFKASCEAWKVPNKFTSMTLRQSSMAISQLGARLPSMPAQLIRMSSGPSCSATWSNMVCTAAGSPTSASTAIALPPLASISLTVAWAGSGWLE